MWLLSPRTLVLLLPLLAVMTLLCARPFDGNLVIRRTAAAVQSRPVDRNVNSLECLDFVRVYSLQQF